MVLCLTNQDDIHIALPVCDTERKLSRDTVTAILVQVNNSDEYGFDIDEPHHADPFTAFDLWFAGLSEVAFKSIDEDLVLYESYRNLLDRSLRRNSLIRISGQIGRRDEERERIH